jgi:glycosyltransferase involved in cell wall biosynthesis
VTTLHGTDITLIGNEPSYSQIVAFSIEQSDGVTAVSNSLRESTYAELQVTREIVVIPNFLDCAVHRRRPRPDLRRHFTGGDERTKIVIHVSNFRPVKRVEAVVDIFNRIQQRRAAMGARVGHQPSRARRRCAGRGCAAAVDC